MKYLLQITRSTRAERFPESEIISDSIKYQQNDFDGMGQYHAGDNFFLIDAASETQLSLDLIKILSTAPFNKYALTEGDGYMVVEYPYSSSWTMASDIRSGSVAKLRTLAQDNVITEVSYNTFAEAQAAIDLLNPSDGYILIDSHPTEPTQVIISRPELWTSNIGDNLPVKQSNYHAGRQSDRSIDRA
jgi:hypothetical protein